MKKKLLIVLTLPFVAVGLVACEKKEEVREPQREEKVESPQPSKSEEYILADRKGCFACHDIDRKKVGPSYVDVAKKYAGKENAVEELVKSMTKGSMGKWGSIPMTPQPVSNEEAKKLAEWILSLK